MTTSINRHFRLKTPYTHNTNSIPISIILHNFFFLQILISCIILDQSLDIDKVKLDIAKLKQEVDSISAEDSLWSDFFSEDDVSEISLEYAEESSVYPAPDWLEIGRKYVEHYSIMRRLDYSFDKYN